MSNDITKSRTYSLGERYQIAQNIRVCKFIFHTVIWIGLLNVISALCLLVDDFEMSIYYRNIIVIIFNYSLLIYGITIVIVMCWYNDGLRAELQKLREQLCCTSKTHPEFVSVVSTMGYEAHVHQRQHAALYFNMLKKDWS
ncbi:unnamed protein product [Cylicostephanus goldi]|uniref:Uncharacterized protein n=1 Tax=Cylicostephanus goldi TaxID=71465 RepID=A0A3P6RZN0_CYLGO|nr:unnamed protein product [Cylicostephanus goldi]